VEAVQPWMPAQARSRVEPLAEDGTSSRSVPPLHLPTCADRHSQSCSGPHAGPKLGIGVPWLGSWSGGLSRNLGSVETFGNSGNRSPGRPRKDSGIDLPSALTRAARHAVTSRRQAAVGGRRLQSSDPD
jgi:hypothetical protein